MSKKIRKATQARKARIVTDELVLKALGKRRLTVYELASKMGMATPYGYEKVRKHLCTMGGKIAGSPRDLKTGSIGRPPMEFAVG